jgi:hypothetical protein
MILCSTACETTDILIYSQVTIFQCNESFFYLSSESEPFQPIHTLVKPLLCKKSSILSSQLSPTMISSNLSSSVIS